MIPSTHGRKAYPDDPPVNSYAESNFNDFVTDLTFNEVPWYDPVANLEILWVKDYGGGTFGVAPHSTYSDLQVDSLIMSLGDSNCMTSATISSDVSGLNVPHFTGEWQPYSEKFLTETLQHEMGHMIGFAHDENPNSLMYSTNSDAFPQEYGIVETTFATTGVSGYTESKHFIPICTDRDVTNFNYSVTGVDNVDNLGIDVHFVPSIDEYIKCIVSPTVNPNTYCSEGTFFDAYPGCSDEDMLTVTGTCNGVEQGSGLLISSSGMSTGQLSYIHVKLQENFDGMQSLSNVATTQEAPIIPTSTQSSRVELLEVSEVEVEHKSVFINGTNFLEIPDITLAQDTVEFSIVGWMEPDFSKGSQDLTIVSKYESFNLFLVGESFKFQNGKTSIVPPTLNFSVYDGIEWYTIQGNTEISEDWHQVAAVVDDSVATLYLNGKVEGKVKLEKEVPRGSTTEAGKCHQKSCIVDVKMSMTDKDLTVGAYVTQKMVKTCCDDDGFIKIVPDTYICRPFFRYNFFN